MRLRLDRREQMIHETSAFLTWALSTNAAVPRIPIRRVDDGGFDMLMRMPGARQAVQRWWMRALDIMDRYRY